MVILFIVLGFIVLFIGFAFVSQATLGVYLAAVACFLVAFARVIQAHDQHKELGLILGTLTRELKPGDSLVDGHDNHNA
jgi:uncharacterized protein (UPF0548 family)